MTAELEDMMQEEMQEKILRNIAKNGKLSTEDLAAMLALSLIHISEPTRH